MQGAYHESKTITAQEPHKIDIWPNTVTFI